MRTAERERDRVTIFWPSISKVIGTHTHTLNSMVLWLPLRKVVNSFVIISKIA